MYVDFFKLQKLPFRLKPDPAFHFLGVPRRIARDNLLQHLRSDGNCCVIQGETGIGKTVMLEDCLERLPSNTKLAHVRHAELTGAEILDAVLSQMQGASSASSDGSMAQLETCAAKLNASGFRVQLAIDNADLLSANALELLLRIAHGNRGTRRIGLIFAARLPTRPAFLRFLSEIAGLSALVVELQPFSHEETASYIHHRLQVAGYSAAPLMGEDACFEMQRFTGGIPRLINSLADACMSAAFSRGQPRIFDADVRACASHLGWVEYRARPVIEAPPPEEPLARGYIRIERQNRIVAECALPDGKITVGRAVRSDIRLESSFVSRDHCQINTSLAGSVIEDLQSQNGLIFNGKRVPARNLVDGDVVQIGDHFLSFSLVSGVESLDSAKVVQLSSAKHPDSDTAQTRIIAPEGLEGDGVKT